MKDIIAACGLFIYPLGLCSILGMFIVIERLIALRTKRVIPTHLQNDIIINSSLPPGEASSVAGRILLFHEQRHPDADQIKAFGKMEVIGMERGLFLLDVVISVAPLLGLLGTVVGLVQVFSQVSPDTGVPEPQAFVSGVALALATTVVGLTVAIPALLFNSVINRRIETLASRLNVLVERIVAIDEKNHASKI
jgi:biopolymer transport protein ExbB